MTQQEIFHGLWMITKERYDACKAEIETIGKDRPTERGALQLKLGIYNVAIAAGLVSGNDYDFELISKRFNNLIKHFTELAAYYYDLPEEEKGRMEIALFPEVFMRANFYETYNNDLAEAKKYGDPKKIFKAKIKKEVLDDILAMWRNFRVQNELFVFAFEEQEG